MFYGNIQRKAFNFNRHKYFESVLIPVSAFAVTVVLAIIPYLLSSLFSFSEQKIPGQYAIYNSVAKCGALVVFSFFSCVFYSCVSLGEEARYIGRMTGKKHCFKRYVYWFLPKNIFKAFALKGTLFVLKTFWSVAFLLPSIITGAATVILALSGGIEVYLFLSLVCGTAALLICGLLFRFIMIQRYFLASFIIAENPKIKVFQSIRQSKNLLDGHLFSIVKFKICFLPLLALCLLIIPAFFIYPHYKQSRTIIAKELMI